MNKPYPFYKEGKFSNGPVESVVINTKRIFFHYLFDLFNFSHIYKSKKHFSTVLQKLQSKFFNILSKNEAVVCPLGHASVFIRYDNFSILIDPVFCAVSFFFKRFSENICMDNFPKIDVVIYSHNHPDHYCQKTLNKILAHSPEAKIIAPLKFERTLKSSSLPDQLSVVTLNWWESYRLNTQIVVTALPAIHWSQSNILDRNETLWGSWMISINNKNIYFAGDTAYGEHFKIIKEHFSRVDVACIPIAPYLPRHIQIDSHIDFLESYQVFLDLGKPFFIPIHWGVFAYGEEKLKEPIEQIILLMEKTKNLSKLVCTGYNQFFTFSINEK